MTHTRAFRTVLVFATAIFLSACGWFEDDAPLTGYVESELVFVSAPQAGWVTELHVSEGDMAVQDAPLFALDTDLQDAALAEARARLVQAEAEARDLETGARSPEIAALEAQLREAEAALAFAKAEQARWANLAARDIASRARSDQADASAKEAQARVDRITQEIAVARLPGRDARREAADALLEAAGAAVAQAEWQRGQREIAARRTGQVEEIFYRAGEYVTQGMPVLALLPEDGLKVRFFVPQATVSHLAPGMTIRIETDGSGDSRSARISHIAREAEFTPPVIYSASVRDSLVFLVEARLDPETDLRPGQPVDVLLPDPGDRHG